MINLSLSMKYPIYLYLLLFSFRGGDINYGITCEDEEKRRNSGTKTKTFEEICYLLLYAVSNKRYRRIRGQLIQELRANDQFLYKRITLPPTRRMHSSSSVKDTKLSFVSNDNDGKMIEKNFIEIEGTFLVKIRDNAFNGIKGENVFEHNFLKIVEPLKIKRLSQDRFSLSVFPTSLSGAARKWFTNECIDTISTWDDLVEKFVQKFYNLSDHHKNKVTSDENNPNIIDNVPEIFKIEEDMFNFDTPLCIAFKEFNYLLKIDHDLFTYDIQRIKTYNEYEQELNNEKHKGLMNNGQRMGFHINLVTIYANCTALKMELQNGPHVFRMPTDIVMEGSYLGCLPDHMDHICEEVTSLHLKLRDRESFIIHQVLAKIKSSLPVLVTTTLQEQLPGLLSATLKDYLLCHFKHGEHQSAEPLVESQGEQPANLKVDNKESAPPASDNKPNEGKELVVHNSKKKTSERKISVEDNSDEDEKQPLYKRFKIMTHIPDIPNLTPLNTFVPEHLINPKEQQKSIQEFTDQKTVAIIEEIGNELVKYQEEGGSDPKMPKVKAVITSEGPLSQEEYNNQIKELKRISDLKAEKEKSE
ncbi:hypothetical protein Tco_1367570 [Tanacetum coccineum]